MINTLAIVVLIPMYDKLLVPGLRKLGRPITLLQRIGERCAVPCCCGRAVVLLCGSMACVCSGGQERSTWAAQKPQPAGHAQPSPAHAPKPLHLSTRIARAESPLSLGVLLCG